MKIEEVDVVIVGGGPAGASLAVNLSMKSQLKIVLIDRTKRELIGGKKSCGDIFFGPLPEDHYLLPREDEIYTIWKEHSIIIDSDGIVGKSPFEDGPMVDRLKYTQRLLSDAEKRGVKIIGGRRVVRPIIEEDFVVGIVAINQETKEEEIYRGRLIADTSGNAHIVRRNIPEDIFPNLEKKISYMLDGYREILKVEHDFDHHLNYYAPSYLPAGSFVWIMGRGKGYVNAGMLLRSNEVLWEKKKIADIVRTIVHEECFAKDQYELVDARGSPIPSGIPMTNIVANGFITFGDAGTQPSPMVGDGITQALYTGESLSEIIIKAFNKGDLSESGIWDANKVVQEITFNNTIAYFKLVAFKEFGTDGLKTMIKRVPEVLGAFFMNRDLSILAQLSTAAKLRGTGLIKALLKIRSNTKALNKIFKIYPNTPEGYPTWRKIFLNFINSLEKPKKKLIVAQ